MDNSTFQPLLDWLVQHPTLSGAVVFGVAAIESLVVIGVLVPGVAFMLGIGTLVGLGLLPLWSTLFWAAAGAVFGDGLGYWLGRHFDKQLRHIWPMTKYPDLIPKGERFFIRHGGKSIVFGRFVGPIRSIIPAIAGMMHMPAHRFYLVNILSALAWAPAVILPGAAFGVSLGLASDVALRLAALLVIVFFVIWFVAWLIKKLFGRLLARLGWRLFLIANTLYRQWPIQSLVGVTSLVASVLLIVSLLILREESSMRYAVSAIDWQLSTWQKLPAYSDMQSQHTPLRIQWQEELSEIQSILHQDGWFDVDHLKLTNASRWLIPNAKLEQLPVWQTRFNTHYESLLMATPVMVVAETGDAGASRSELVLLRLWQITTESVLNPPIWIGSLSRLTLKRWPFDINQLQEDTAQQREWQRFLQSLSRSTDALSVKWVSRDGDTLRPSYLGGDVLLLTTGKP